MEEINLIKDKLYNITQKHNIYDFSIMSIQYLDNNLIKSLLIDEMYLYKLIEFIEYYKNIISENDKKELYNIYKSICNKLNIEYYKILENYIN